MKRLLLTTALLSFTAIAQAKAINLSCEWINVNNEKKPLEISMDTGYGTASVSGAFQGTGKLFSDGAAYWFTTIDKSGVSGSKIQVDRNDLSLLIFSSVMGIENTFQGQCKIANKKVPKI